MIQPWHLVLVALGYFSGAIPFGLLVSQRSGVDIRKVGSGNTGATNILRAMGWKAAALVFALDFFKAALPVLLARLVTGEPAVEVATGVAAVLGHNWSIYLKGGGGRGVSSAFGVLMVTSPPVGLVTLAAFIALVAATKYVSLGSVVGVVIGAALLITHVAVAGLTPLGSVSIIDIPKPAHIIFALVVGPLVILQHRDNIRRLLTGTERKLGQRAA